MGQRVVWAGGIALGAILAALAGCEQILGLDAIETYSTGGSGGTTSTAGSGGTGGTTMSTGGTTTTSSGGDCTNASRCPQPSGECKMATCDTATGMCGEGDAPDGTPAQSQTTGDCKENVCEGGTVVSVDKDDDVEDDGKDCTTDGCSAGTPTHDPIALAACDDMGGQVCDAGGTGNCVECNDDNDCLGNPEGKTKCDLTQICVMASCLDGAQNGTETDVDCGGPVCGKCADTLDCMADGDCQSNNCDDSNNTCVTGTCDDGILNNMQLGETDVDCGGATCPKCAFDKDCSINGDCIGGVCSGSKCAATCTDTAKNQDESDVDCGGVCDDCPNGADCNTAADCQSNFCSAGTCAACVGDGQCAGAEYCSSGVCVPDLMTGAACTAGTQCQTGNCVDGRCCLSTTCGTCEACDVAGLAGACNPVAAGQTDPGTCNMAGQQCDGFGNCKKVLGQSCAAGAECLSNFCVDGVCCGTTCTVACRACNVAGALGTCSIVPAGQEDNYPANACTGVNSCDSTGACKKDNGQTCAAASECVSGFCVDGRCCGASSCPTCQSCAVSGLQGTCQNIAQGSPDTNPPGACVGSNACDGTGNCDLANGQSCTMGSGCVSGNCVDGVCCNNACTGLCMACNIPGAVGTCAPNLAGTESGNECGGPAFCNGQGACGTGAQGVGCSGGGCTAGLTCVDGVCCNTACFGLCEACVMSKTGTANGTCAGITPGTDPDGECTGGTPNCSFSNMCGP